MAASSGTLVAAGLETSGYLGQTLVLEQLWPWILGLGVLLFICSCTRIILRYVYHGTLDGVTYLLLGPCFFLFVTTTTTRSSGVEWQFGNFTGKQELVQKITNDAVRAEVSLVFDLYNRVVSSLVRNTITVLSNDEAKDQLAFINRAALLDMMMRSNIGSPGLMGLIHEGLQGKCAHWMDSARKIAYARTNPQYAGTPEYNNALFEYTDGFSRKSLQLDLNASGSNYLIDLLASMSLFEERNGAGGLIARGPNGFIDRYCGGSDDLKEDFRMTPEEVVDSPMSCEQVWCWTAMGLHSEAKSLIDKAVDMSLEETPVGQSLSDGERLDLIRDILYEIVQKMSPEDGNPDISVLPIIIGSFLLRQELSRDPRSSMFSQFAEHSSVYTRPFNIESELGDDDLALLREKMEDYNQANAMRTEIFAFAMMMPHVQGVLLHALAIAFPFFALLLIVPGHASGFIGWFTFWAWVKSWDIGWAVVMIIDDVVWNFMPNRSVYAPLAGDEHSPITVLDSVFDSDPTYSLTMYYTILGMLVTGVPMVTAQVMLRGKYGLASSLIGGLRSAGMSLGGAQASASQKAAAIRSLTAGTTGTQTAVPGLTQNPLTPGALSAPGTGAGTAQQEQRRENQPAAGSVFDWQGANRGTSAVPVQYRSPELQALLDAPEAADKAPAGNSQPKLEAQINVDWTRIDGPRH